MISMVSIFLVLMLTIGGNTAYINTPSILVHPEPARTRSNMNEKPRPGAEKIIETKNGRVRKAVTVGSTTKTTNYYYSGIHVIEERDGSDNVLNQYIYGTGIDEILRMDKYSGSTSTPYYFHTNAIGSVTAITDGNGSLVERVSYDIFGMPRFTDAAGEIVSKSTIGNTLLFHGRQYDAETNLYYFRARYYDPIMGRFLQTDPMGYADSMNLYQGFNMNTINFVDPYGEITYSQFENAKIQDMLNKGYSYEEIGKFLSKGTFKRGYLKKVDYSNELYLDWNFSSQDTEYNAWGRDVALWIQNKATIAKSFWSSSDNVLVHTIGASMSDFGGGAGQIFNLGTRSGDTIASYQHDKNFENFLLMGVTIWGEAGEAFLTVYGGMKGYQKVKSTNPALAQFDDAVTASALNTIDDFKSWYKSNKAALQSGHIGGYSYKGPKPTNTIYKYKNKKGITQWKEVDTGRFTSPKTFQEKLKKNVNTPADALIDMITIEEGKKAAKKLENAMTTNSGLDAVLELFDRLLEKIRNK